RRDDTICSANTKRELLKKIESVRNGDGRKTCARARDAEVCRRWLSGSLRGDGTSSTHERGFFRFKKPTRNRVVRDGAAARHDQPGRGMLLWQSRHNRCVGGHGRGGEGGRAVDRGGVRDVPRGPGNQLISIWTSWHSSPRFSDCVVTKSLL